MQTVLRRTSLKGIAPDALVLLLRSWVDDRKRLGAISEIELIRVNRLIYSLVAAAASQSQTALPLAA